MRRRAVLFAAVLLGCGAKSGLEPGVGRMDAGAPSRGDAGGPDADAPDAGPPPPDASVCPRTATLTFETADPTAVLLVLDASSSMRSTFGGTLTRWSAVTEALIGVDGAITRLEHRVPFGIVRYSALAVCPLLDVRAARLDARDAIAEVLSAEPGGSTPTGEALERVHADLATLADPASRVSVVLATDGEPIGCTPATVPEAPQRFVVGQVEALAARGAPTFVLSVGSELSEQHLQDIANAGAGVLPGEPDAPAWRADDPAALTELLADAIGAAASCVATLPWTLEGPCAAEVRLGGERLMCQTSDGFTIDGDRLVLAGAACRAWEEGAAAVVQTRCR